jgi:hypothetical protein
MHTEVLLNILVRGSTLRANSAKKGVDHELYGQHSKKDILLHELVPICLR